MGAGRTTRYPGAQPFPDDDLCRKLYFGREEESKKLLNQILAHRLVVVYARSGLGKTSLLNAGIAENLRAEGYLPLSVRVNDIGEGPIKSVFRGIVAACRSQGVEYVAGNTAGLWLFFKTAEFWRNDVLLTPVLILDQFEELFTLQTEPNRSQFIDQLSYLARGVRPPEPQEHTKQGPVPSKQSLLPTSDSPPDVRIVLSLRQDFLPELEEIADRIPGVLDERFRLVPLRRDAASRALQEPAHVKDASLATQPFELEPQAVGEILDFLEQRTAGSGQKTSGVIEPFQLQLICQRLEETVKKKQKEPTGCRTEITLAEVGGARRLGDILKDFYQEQIKVLPWLERRRVRWLCAECLISFQGRRLRMEETEIRRIAKVRPETLKILAEKRLIRSDQTDTGTYYELSHDSLVKPILSSGWLYRFFGMGAYGIAAVLIGLLSVLLIIGSLTIAIIGVESDVLGKKKIESDTVAGLLAVLFLFIISLGWLGWSIRKARYSWSSLRRLRI